MSGLFVVLEYNPERGYYWQWGKETFYNPNREMLFWATAQAARAWLKEHYPHLVIKAKPGTQARLGI